MTIDVIAARRPTRWNAGLWVAQSLLAVAYLMAGGLKLSQSIDALVGMGMAYAADVPEVLIRFVGTMEVLGAIGLILPAALRIVPFLTPLAAVGLSLVQVCAIVLHASRGETAMTLPLNLLLLALSLFIVWGRFARAPIPRRA
jgi:putative oxidoreductase